MLLLCCPQVAGSIELLCPDACPCFSKRYSFYYSCYFLGECQLPHTVVKKCFCSCKCSSSGNTHVQGCNNFLIEPFDITGCLCIFLMLLPHDMLCGIHHPNLTSVNVFSRMVPFQPDHVNPHVLEALSLSAYLTGTPGLCLPSSPLFSTLLRCFMFPFYVPFSSYLGLIKSFITSPSSPPAPKHC